MPDSTVQTIEIEAAPEAVFAVAADVAAYPEWADGVKEVQVLATDDAGRVTEAHFVIDAMLKVISYTLDYSYEGSSSMSWVARPNDDLRSLEGSYEFTPLDDGGTSVVYALKAEPAFSIPGFLKRQVEKQIVGTALRGLRKRVEATGG